MAVNGTDSRGNQQPILTSGGEVRSSDPAQLQSFSYSATVLSSGPLAVSVTVNNTQETSSTPDSWGLSVTVQNPFTTNPYKIVNSNVRGREQ